MSSYILCRHCSKSSNKPATGHHRKQPQSAQVRTSHISAARSPLAQTPSTALSCGLALLHRQHQTVTSSVRRTVESVPDSACAESPATAHAQQQQHYGAPATAQAQSQQHCDKTRTVTAKDGAPVPSAAALARCQPPETRFEPPRAVVKEPQLWSWTVQLHLRSPKHLACIKACLHACVLQLLCSVHWQPRGCGKLSPCHFNSASSVLIALPKRSAPV